MTVVVKLFVAKDGQVTISDITGAGTKCSQVLDQILNPVLGAQVEGTLAPTDSMLEQTTTGEINQHAE